MPTFMFYSMNAQNLIHERRTMFMKKIIGVTVIAIFSAVIKAFIED